MSSKPPIIIIGAGVVGLVLAQALKKEGIPFLIFDRDAHVDARGQGWGITIHWALPALQHTFPPELFDRLQEIQVDPEVGRNDTGQFLFLNLKTAEPRWKIPPNSKRLRINRERFRKLLLNGVEVQWNKSIVNIETCGDDMLAVFQDGERVRGRVIVGADGATSKTRRILCPDTGLINHLPVRFIGCSIRLTPSEIAPLRALDPLLFQGTHPDTNTYMWYSVLDTPEVNGSSGEDEYYSIQLNISWRVRGPDDEVPSSSFERLKRMKLMAEVFEERLKKVVQSIPDEAEVLEIKLADWPCLEWPNHGGKVTLIGDAAHAMTMYRGEAANHGITDVNHLHDRLLEVSKGEKQQDAALASYEQEMRARTKEAVLLSRQACLDAHDWKLLNENSAVLAKRAEKDVKKP